MDLLGRSGAKLVPAFADGGDAIREAMQQIEDAGVISNETALASEDLQDAILLMDQAFTKLRSETLTPLIPLIEDTTEGITEMVKAAGDSEEIGELAESLASLGESLITVGSADEGAVGAVVVGLTKLAQVLTVVVDGAKLVTAAIRDTISAVVEFDIGLIEVIAGAQSFREVLDRMIPDRVISQAKELGDSFSGLIGATDDIVESTDRIGDELVDLSDRLSPAGDLMVAFGFAVATTAAGERTLAGNVRDATAAIEEQVDALDALMNAQFAAFQATATSVGMTKEQEAAEVELVEGRKRRGDVYEQLWADEADAADEAAEKTKDAAEKAVVVLDAATKSLVMNSLSAVGTLSDIAINAILDSSETLTKGQKDAAIALFVINKAAAVATGAVNTALAISNALAAASPPLNFVLAAAAGVAGVAATAAIAAEPPPSFHTGGIIGDVGINAQEGEGILNRRAVQEIGAEGVDSLNRGGGMGDRVVVVNQTNNRSTFAATYEMLRTGVDPVSKLVQGFQPTQVGLATIGIQP